MFDGIRELFTYHIMSISKVLILDQSNLPGGLSSTSRKLLVFAGVLPQTGHSTQLSTTYTQIKWFNALKKL